MSLAVGATNGPVDFSVSVAFLVTETATVAFLLDGNTAAANLQLRFLAAESDCETQGNSTCQMTLSPLEAGFVMGALAAATCQFSMGLRCRVQMAVSAKLAQVGAKVL